MIMKGGEKQMSDAQYSFLGNFPAWCSVVRNISLGSSGHLSRLCSLPVFFCAAPRQQSMRHTQKSLT